MRIVNVEVSKWRNLEGVALAVPSEARLVCLVGENGSGKSTVLELISYAAHHLGLSSGVESPRGDPSQDDHEFRVTAVLPQEIADSVCAEVEPSGSLSWDGTIQLESARNPQTGQRLLKRAVGIQESYAGMLAERAISRMRARSETQHLYLDADRAYPPVQIQPHQFGEIWGQDWASPDFTRQWSFRTTKTLYEEWHKYFIATEEKFAADYVANTRRAIQSHANRPDFVDPFDSYRGSVLQVLPHLNFVGIQTAGATRTIVFDSAGLELPFSKLSGGEREIAFLVGQIERFGLRNGLLLIDEPELHLNPDLLRTWVAFLRDTVLDGQVWVATHSLEAVEVTGPDASFVFERDPINRITRSVAPLGARPVISALSAAIGAPAFSLSRLRFVLIEGDRQSRERERFFDVCGEPDVNRFIEGGSCHEVIRRLEYVRDLAAETGEQLRVGGVIDRDFRSDAEADRLEETSKIHVLGCHEVENLYLSPETLEVFARRSGVAPGQASSDLLVASDEVAGLWVGQRAASVVDGPRPKSALATWSGLGWSEVAGRATDYLAANRPDFEDEVFTKWEAEIRAAIDEYRARREQADLWLYCLGKQVAAKIAPRLGFRSASFLYSSAIQLWRTGEVPTPAPVLALREYITSLSTI